MNRATTGIAALTVSLATIATGCGNSDPLAISCSDFMTKDATTQLTLASRWGAPDREHVGPMEEVAGASYKDDLIRYCPDHPKTKLSELELRLTGG